MNEEEKQAIEYWKTHMEILHCNTQIASENYIKVLLDLVEKQQKEIEKLKSRKYIFNAETNEIKEIPISDDYISKDKIEEKIKELESHIWKDGYMGKFDRYAIHYLKELLGE